MKNTRVNGVPNAAVDLHAVKKPRSGPSQCCGVTHSGVADAAMPHRLKQTLAQLGEIKRALETSQKESDAARQQIAALMDAAALLRQKVTRLEREVVRVHEFAYHDELTGLANRGLLRDRLNQAIIQAARQNKQVGLLMLDLDGFKSVNDRLGHATGDKLLQRVAERLLSCIRSADTACRYGGDEFVILLSEIDGEQNAAEVAQKLRAQLAKPYIFDDHSVLVTASIGVAVYPCDGSSQNDLIRRADIAMYLAKAHNITQIRSLQSPRRS